MNKLIASVSFLALAMAAPVLAAPAPGVPDEGAAAVDPVVVTPTRLPTPKLDVASSVTVITGEDIAIKQEQTLPDVLKDAPGLNVVQTGGAGGQASVFMRGTNSNHVKVLVDGIDVSDPSQPGAQFDFGQLPASDVARVEILRGPQSGLYGSDAIGGVINVITEGGEGRPRLTADVEGGSFGTVNERGGLLGSSGPFHYALSIVHLQSRATPVTPLDLLAPGEQRLDDYYDNDTASTKLGLKVAPNFDLGFVGRYTQTHALFTGEDESNFPVDFPAATQTSRYTRQYYGRGTAHLSLLDGRFDQTLGVGYSNIASIQNDPSFGLTLNAGDRLKVDWQGNVKLIPGETLVLGAEHQRDAVRRPLVASTAIDAGYAELQSQLFDHLNSTLAVRYDANSRFGGKATWRFAPTYFFEQTGTKLKASIGTGFKAPTLSQLFQSFPPFFFSNPNLRPESSTGWDAGFDEFLLGRRLQFGATYFHNNIRNLIDTDPTGTTLANVGRAHTDGVESYVALQPIENLTLRLDYTYTEAVDDIAHEALLRRPKNKWNVEARWRPIARLTLDANLVQVGSWIDGNRDFSIPRLKAPGYTTLDLAADYDLTDQVTLYGRITNLADARYEDPVGFLRPSRGFFIGARLKL
ncbi:MAG: TonB-dependent receptor [Caulobacteraceae bacterium]|nr:TonB-dependent receptor [Caulobacteraceae bacterium]